MADKCRAPFTEGSVMVRHKHIDMVGVVLGRETAQSRAANHSRSRMIGYVLGDVETAVGRPISPEIVTFFVPQVRSLIQRDANWVVRMLGQMREGHGISQETFARLCVVLARMPEGTRRPFANLAPTPSRIVLRNPQWPAAGKAKYLRFEPGNSTQAEPVNDPKSWIEQKGAS